VAARRGDAAPAAHALLWADARAREAALAPSEGTQT
jgi:hypothetical protein